MTASLFPEHLADLQKSGLSDITISAMKVCSKTASELQSLLEWHSFPNRASGYAIPYLDPISQQAHHYNYRLFNLPTSEKNGQPSKALKYAKPRSTPNLLYWPPGIQQLLGQTDYCIVTEGEKKAAKAVQEGFPCVAIGGVWNWAESEQRKVDKAAGKMVNYSTIPLPGLLNLSKERKLILLFDSDTESNDDVKNALFAMRDALLFHGANWVRRISMPTARDDGNSDKVGLDDLLLCERGPEALQQAIKEALQKPSSELRPLVKFRYDKDSSGQSLYYIVNNAKKGALPAEKCIQKQVENKNPDGTSHIVPMTISKTRIWLTRTIKDIDTGKTFYEAAYIPHDEDCPRLLRGGEELLLSGPTPRGDPYAGHGASILQKQRPALAEFLQDYQSSGRVSKVAGTTHRGWVSLGHQSAEQFGFLTENAVITADKVASADDVKCPVVPIHPGTEIRTGGFTLSTYGDVCTTAITLLTEVLIHPLPALVCGAAVASLMRKWCPESENLVVHLYGDSSGGKTTCLRAAASIFGDPSTLIDTWRATENGLEGRHVARNDLPVFLDEAGLQENSKVLANIAYLIGNGTGKIRANEHGGVKSNKSFRAVTLSTGEKTLMDGAGEVTKAGQEVRLMQVPSDLGGKLWGSADAKDIERLKRILAQNYGGLMPRIVTKILKIEKDAPGGIASYMNIILGHLRSHLPSDTPDNVVRRMVHFASIATGLRMLFYVTLELTNERDVAVETDKRTGKF